MQFKQKCAHIALGVLLVMVVGLLGVASISWAAAWTQKADMPTTRVGLSTSVVNGKIYAIGGMLNADVALSTVEVYEPATDTWTKKADMPTARGYLGTSVVNGIIYAIGGGTSGRSLTTVVEAYDPATDTWTKKANSPTPRVFLSTSVVNGIIYAIGGKDVSAIFFSTVEAYDPATDTWTKKADMPTTRAGLSTSVVNGIIYAVGGTDGSAMLSTIEAYDPATDSWTKKADMPLGRVLFSTSVVNGIIYTIGGAYTRGGAPGVATVEAYDPATDTWTIEPEMPTPRVCLGTSVVNGRIYAIGGGLAWDVPLEEGVVEEYDPGFLEGPGYVLRSPLFTPEEILADGTMQTILTVEAIPVPFREGELSEVTADLSPIGGSPEALMYDDGTHGDRTAGDGIYTLQTTVPPGTQTGKHYVKLTVEDNLSRKALALRSLAVYPGRDEYIYQDQMGPRWEVKVSSAELDLTASDIVHQGSYSQAINSKAFWGYIRYTFKDPDGLSTFGYTALEFWINPGTSSTEKATFGLMTTEGAKYPKLKDDLGITLEPNVWQVISIPLEDLGLVDTRLKYIQLQGVEGTFYLDDLGLAVAQYRLAEAGASPEKVKADGKMPTILTVQAVPAVTQPGPLPTVTIDLTPIGGSPETPMSDDGTHGDKTAGDGIYTFRMTVGPEIPNGLKDLVISSTDRRLRVARTHLSLGVLPTEEVSVYRDEIAPRWKVRTLNVLSDPSATSFVYDGEHSLEISLEKKTSSGFVSYSWDDPEGFGVFGYELVFHILVTEPGQDPELVFTPVTGKARKLRLGDQLGEPGTWEEIRIPLEDFRLKGFSFQSSKESATFYVDNMRFVPEEVEIPTAVEEVSEATAVPLGYSLAQNYPNPFNPLTTIPYNLPQASDVTLTIYTITGQKVATVVSDHQEVGHYQVVWDGRGFGTGVYFYRLEAGEFVEAKRMLLLK